MKCLNKRAPTLNLKEIKLAALCLIVAATGCHLRISDSAVSGYPPTPMLVITAWLDACYEKKWIKANDYWVSRRKYRVNSKSTFQLFVRDGIESKEQWQTEGKVSFDKYKLNTAYVSLCTHAYKVRNSPREPMIATFVLTRKRGRWRIHNFWVDIF